MTTQDQYPHDLNRVESILKNTTPPQSFSQDAIDTLKRALLEKISAGTTGHAPELSLNERASMFDYIVRTLNLGDNPNYLVIKASGTPIGFVKREDIPTESVSQFGSIEVEFGLYGDSEVFTTRQITPDGNILTTEDGIYQLGHEDTLMTIEDGPNGGIIEGERKRADAAFVLYNSDGVALGTYELDENRRPKKTNDGKYFLRGISGYNYPKSTDISLNIGDTSFPRIIRDGMVQKTADGRYEVAGPCSHLRDYSENANWLSFPGNHGNPDTFRELDPSSFAIKTTADGRYEIQQEFAETTFEGCSCVKVMPIGNSGYDEDSHYYFLDKSGNLMTTTDGKYLLIDYEDGSLFDIMNGVIGLVHPATLKVVDFGYPDETTRYPMDTIDNNGVRLRLFRPGTAPSGYPDNYTEYDAVNEAVPADQYGSLVDFDRVIVNENGDFVRYVGRED